MLAAVFVFVPETAGFIVRHIRIKALAFILAAVPAVSAGFIFAGHKILLYKRVNVVVNYHVSTRSSVDRKVT